MDGPEPIERTQYQPQDKVQPLQHSERDKRRKFSKDLKDKLEDDLEKGRKHQQKDELILAQDEESDSRDRADDESQQEESSTSSEERPETDAQEDSSEEEHIDLKA
jgi:hypothetical protein